MNLQKIYVCALCACIWKTEINYLKKNGNQARIQVLGLEG